VATYTHQVLTRQRAAGKVTLRDMRESFNSKIDNTGNVCIWPSEEVMTFCLLQRTKDLQGMNICELAAGVGLAGLVLAATVKANSVLITDGNAQCVETLGVALQANKDTLQGLACEASVCLYICIYMCVCVLQANKDALQGLACEASVCLYICIYMCVCVAGE
jgi:hypothetical protein